MKTKLDTRAARCDLTSRECSKLICGALAGALGAGVERETLQQMIKVINLVQYENAETRATYGLEILTLMKEIKAHESVAAGTSAKMLMLGAMLGAIQEQAAPGSMRDACRWILQQGDDFWQALQVGMEQAAAAAQGRSS